MMVNNFLSAQNHGEIEHKSHDTAHKKFKAEHWIGPTLEFNRFVNVSYQCDSKMLERTPAQRKLFEPLPNLMT